MPVTPDEFKAALARFASGVTVVTLTDTNGDHGMTASAFTSVSLDPPLVLVCVTKGNATHERLVGASGFAINILAADQVTVSNRFAGWWDEGKSKWDDLTLSRGAVSGAPLIGGALAQLDCSAWSTADGGDHTLFIGQVESATVSPSAPDALAPLLYFAGGYRTIGAAP